MTDSDKLIFGAHATEDGNGWIGEDHHEGIEFKADTDRICIFAGCRWEGYGYDLDRQATEQLRDWLTHWLEAQKP